MFFKLEPHLFTKLCEVFVVVESFEEVGHTRDSGRQLDHCNDNIQCNSAGQIILNVTVLSTQHLNNGKLGGDLEAKNRTFRFCILHSSECPLLKDQCHTTVEPQQDLEAKNVIIQRGALFRV